MKIFTWKQRLLVVAVTAGIVLVFGAIGYGFGSLFENWKLGVVVGVLISYPVSLWSLAKASMKLYKKENPEA